MNEKWKQDIPEYQIQQFQAIINKLYQCCQERMQYQSERFHLPDAELRCLLLFGEERYLTAKGIAHKMNVVKGRVTKIVGGLVKKGYVARIKDPEDSRVTLLALTTEGRKKLDEVADFQEYVHTEVLRKMGPEQRMTVLTHLETLKASLEAVKEHMV